MQTIITVTSKGQISLPVAARKKLGLKEQGDRLLFELDESTNQVTLRKVRTIEEISEYLTSKIKPGTKPVLNADEYYQKHRGKFIR